MKRTCLMMAALGLCLLSSCVVTRTNPSIGTQMTSADSEPTLEPQITLTEQVRPPTKPANKSQFASEACAQPCWEGLQPGKTTRQDLERYFETQFDSDWRASLMINTAA